MSHGGPTTSEVLGGRRRSFRAPVARMIATRTAVAVGAVGVSAVAVTAAVWPNVLSVPNAIAAAATWVAVSVATASGLGWSLSRSLARPADTLLALKRIDGNASPVELDDLSKATAALEEMLVRGAHEKTGRIGELSRALDNARSDGRSRANFFASMSHELRTPLNAIIGYAMLLAEDAAAANQPEQARDLDRILESSRHLLKLINDVLDLSRLDAGEVAVEAAVIDVAALLDSAKSTVAEAAENVRASLDIHVAPNARVMIGDALRLRQCLTGLLGALIETHPNGSVRVDVVLSEADDANIEFRLTDNDGRLVTAATRALEVEISQMQGEDMPALAPDVLAMAVTRRLAKLMGGALGVEPAANGDVAVLTLPVNASSALDQNALLPDAAPVAVEPAVPARAASDQRTVLVIDDDPSVVDLTSRWLTAQGYRVITASSGPEGLALMRTDWPDYIVLDVFMPGQSGYEVLAEIKADPRGRNIPVVIVSSDDNRQLGLESGAAEVLVKPLSRKRLGHVLDVLSAQVPGDILVVDDDEDVRELVCRFASQAGLSVRVAADGDEGLALARASTPGAIVLDLRMPGMDGFAMIDALAGDPNLSQVPVMVLSQLNISVQEHARIRKAGHAFHPKWNSSPTQVVENIKSMVAR